MKKVLPEYVKKCVRESVKTQGFENFEIISEGNTDVGDGYATDIYFVKVTENSSKEGKELQLALKTAKIFKSFNNGGLKEFYRREKYVYSDIFPVYRKFEVEKLGKDSLDYVPTCYGTFEEEDRVILSFENLRKKNYKLHDRQKSMNQQHIEKVLRSYAHFHALSLAFKDQHPDQFQRLTKNYTSIYEQLLYGEFGPVFEENVAKNIKDLTKHDPELVEKLEKIVEKGAKRTLLDILKEPLDQYVTTHGDCWNNNFLFQYNDNNEESPSGVMVLDWQLSSLQSPVIDIIQFLFLTVSQEQAANFDYYKTFYYSNLSKFIQTLDSDPNKLFPIEKFSNDWKKLTTYGLIYATGILSIIFCDKDKIVDMEQVESQEKIKEAFSSDRITDRTKIDARLLALSRYYFQLNQ